MKYPEGTVIRWVYGPDHKPMSRKAAKRAYRALGSNSKDTPRLTRTAVRPEDM